VRTTTTTTPQPAPAPLISAVETTAHERRALGTLVSQADFFVGAATVFQYLGYTIPPLWYFALLSGRDVLEERDSL